MIDGSDLTLANYQAIIAPFLMMTSCATLVWALQTRFSRLVQAIRTLTHDGERDNISYHETLSKQIAWLKDRSRLLRNGITALYFSMCCFLVTAMLLTLDTLTVLNLSYLVVALFLLGLVVVGAALVAALVEISRSFDSLREEIENR